MNDSNLAEVVSLLMVELASELDLHYEPEDFPHLRTTIASLTKAAEALKGAGHPVPEAYAHIVGRFRRSQN